MSNDKTRGRPTKFKPEYVRQLIDFFDIEPYQDKDIPHYKNGELAWTDTKRVAERIPTLRSFAKSIEVGTSTVYDWINPEHASYQKDFSDTYKHACKELIKWFLVENGLNGCFNPIFAKFVAVNMTDMRDRQDHNHGLTDPMAEILKEIAERQKPLVKG